ncbi:hypothetical protein BC628DRAFT_1409595 [Trametes gibbosa]|nr:hypothetical protein BC628DRAFT_1409595 [Trametes gibbosa]
MSSPSPKPSRLAPYKEALAALSQRTRTPLPSLAISFAILHELTAILPLVGFFYGARTFGVGESVVRAIAHPEVLEIEQSKAASRLRDTWAGERFREWMIEGETRVERVGRRYGWFGFERGSKPDSNASVESQTARSEAALVSGRIAGDVANAVVAYALTKAFIPVRIGLSLYLSPAFSRTVVQPIGSTVARLFRR